MSCIAWYVFLSLNIRGSSINLSVPFYILYGSRARGEAYLSLYLQLEQMHYAAGFELGAYFLERHGLLRLPIPTLNHVQLLACIN